MFEIKTSTRRFAVKDDKEEQYFDTVLNLLLNIRNQEGGSAKKQEISGGGNSFVKPITEEKPPVLVEQVAGTNLPPKVPEHQEAKGEYKETEYEGIKGFLHVVCEHCGAVSMFFAKNEIRARKCHSCKEEMQLHKDAFRMMYINCECGAALYYKTNALESEFDVECKECQSPVAVEWNPKKKHYQTMNKEHCIY